ncbi:MAG: ATP-binding cassette domain-containing protein [Holosporaceae bacterium]|jgi:ABC-type sugar transport system ATPase subunit|nr:ATP-binding cassette domain-containing protein [Holosporaceae bacterium]
MASIVLKNVSKSFRDSHIIKNVSLDIEDGECTVLVGPSGCGKSTILRLICGLEEADSGEIFIGDRYVNDVPPASRGIAMVFQTYALYPHMTVFENMAFALRVRRLKKEVIEERVLNAAKILKIDHLLQRTPKELSGGQRQRAAIGRAIVRNPYAFLFDEPLSNLDSALRCQMRYELARLKAQLKTTMVYVTHDQAEAMTLADKIVVMRDGAVEQVGTPMELYNCPANIFVAKFIGSSEMNIFDVSFLKHAGNYSIFQLPTGETVSFFRQNGVKFEVGSRYNLGVRPENIEILAPDAAFDGNRLLGKFSLLEDLGGEGIVHLSLQDGSQITVKTKKSFATSSESNHRDVFFEKVVGGAPSSSGEILNRRESPQKPSDNALFGKESLSFGDGVTLGFALGHGYLFDENGNTILCSGINSYILSQ